jgi:ribosomal protein S13
MGTASYALHLTGVTDDEGRSCYELSKVVGVREMSAAAICKLKRVTCKLEVSDMYLEELERVSVGMDAQKELPDYLT